MADVSARFRDALGRLLPAELEGPVVVAVSGGRDSMVLLDLVRSENGLDADRIVVAHLDHAMRVGSAADADWVAAEGARLGLQVRSGRVESPVANEGEARVARYEFLHGVAGEEGAIAILTAHHADDQAETVLFRAVRGSGIPGLVGIRERRGDGVLRPLLGITASEIAEYAEARGIGWREDPSNLELGIARNVIRHEVLPLLEDRVADGARAALSRLAALAAADERALTALLAPHLDALVRPSEVGGAAQSVAVDRPGLASFVPEVRARILRAAAERVGLGLSQAATALLDAFCLEAPSGASLALRGGGIARREYETILISAGGDGPAVVPEPPTGGGTGDAAPAPELVIDDPGPSAHDLDLGEGPIRVQWSPVDEAPSSATAAGGPDREAWFDIDELAFPLRIRSRQPGDRIELHGGTKKVKKLLNEARVGVTRRDARPLLVDANGAVLWIPLVARSTTATPTPGAPAFRILATGP